MTDFFLTYRSFISPTQHCKPLILRFRWALENDGPERKIVRIRTFVMMRHWLLNYFVHDFIPSRDLRAIAPPPPPAHQERIEEKVRATLPDGLLRRKTALVRGMECAWQT
ncbi:hypothetical protein DM01DRAFT_358238 [Hesseltinella vesiculosa]|uniref:N-terminal Ras-GEF domain-containing protein n=1 Tax=Hesseltinella vesiculosa TaxID=101127 RepID=A0A1X2GWP1_9FUNG|nr:hypothetical protein DM01DRAFT_358238 [Hesseltinella vesiculosa]